MSGTKCEEHSRGAVGATWSSLGNEDRRFKRIAWVNIVLTVLTVAGLVIALHASEAAAAIGIDPPLGQLTLSLLLAALVMRLHAWLRPRVDADVLRESRTLQDAFRRYVPDAVLALLESGHELEPVEREVSVLFVDIRGYTTFSEECDPAELFSTVSRYTATVSEIVRHHGGSVAEFHGDGMMAVFGAPYKLPEKARAAVTAGRAIVAAVRSVTAPQNGGNVPLSVGVGIATGPAFVGNIQAADRVIWTAIGDTTNLAARLQDLTRDLRAAIVIDESTRRAAYGAVIGFERHGGVRIRGRRNAEDVYALRAVP